MAAANLVKTAVDFSGGNQTFTHYLKYNPDTAALSNYPIRGGDSLQCTAVLEALGPTPAHGLTRSVDRFTVLDVHPPRVLAQKQITKGSNNISVEFEVRETW